MTSTDVPTLSRRERTITRWIIVAIVAVLAVAVLRSLITGGATPAEDGFVAEVRQENPQLSVAVASDDELLDVALTTCSPDGISRRDVAWLRSIDVA